jgi:iron complex transport system substrate-binding protein
MARWLSGKRDSLQLAQKGTCFMKRVSLFIMIVLLGIGAISSLQAQSNPIQNLAVGCIEAFDPAVDYFPVKSQVEYANGLEIEYFNSYKVVRNSLPWPGASDGFEYVLVQCGAPAPEGFGDAQVVEVPSGRVISMSTSQLPQLRDLGLLDQLVGLDTGLYVNTPEVVELIEAGELIEIGSGSGVNVELALAAEPSIIFTYGYGAADFDAYPVLIDAGIPVAINGDWAETTPLGRAEWIKFLAVFYNREAEANAIFEEIESQYQALVALTADLPAEAKPLVLPNAFSTWDEAWNMPGGDSYVAQLLQDSGAQIVLGDSSEVQGQVGSVPFSFEAVYEAGLEAELWLTNEFDLPDIAALLARDERYADFNAVSNGGVYNTDRRVNANGGNDYWETGVSYPHLILADLIAVFHPDLLPEHELMFLRQLQ